MTDTLTTPVWNGTCHPAAELFPMLDDTELASLVAAIKEHGLNNPGWLLPDGTLLDGRNRRLACEQAGVKMRWRIYEGDDEIGFAISENVERRHLTTGQKAMAALAALPLYAARAKARQVAAGVLGNVTKHSSLGADLPQARNASPTPPAPEKERGPRARDEAASDFKTSSKSVAQAKRVMDKAPELAAKVAAGTLALDAAEKQVKRQESQREEQQAREIVMAPVVVDASGPGWRLLSGDFRDRLMELPAGCVDLIITDPPYPNEFLPLYGDLSKVAQHLLTDDGICLVMTGQIHLDQVVGMMATHLNYGWTYCQPLPGANSRIMARQIMQSWKPWLAFTKNKWPSGRIEWHPDVLKASARSKDQYRWQQDATPAQMLAIELCPEGGTICDPFMGTGAYGAMTLKIGRQFIGVEIDAARFNTTKEKFNV